MMGSTWKLTAVSAGALAGLLVLASGASSQGQMGHGGMPGMAMPEGGAKPAPIRTTMGALHQHGGVPPGWRFLMPPGNPAEGRKVYAALECFKCHAIQGESFPGATEPGGVGPELTGMGRHHPPEYFAESILNPNRVIVEDPGFTGPDGLSKMPDYGESLTLRQLVDLVAYLGSLTAGGHPMSGPMPPAPPKGQ